MKAVEFVIDRFFQSPLGRQTVGTIQPSRTDPTRGITHSQKTFRNHKKTMSQTPDSGSTCSSAPTLQANGIWRECSRGASEQHIGQTNHRIIFAESKSTNGRTTEQAFAPCLLPTDNHKNHDGRSNWVNMGPECDVGD